MIAVSNEQFRAVIFSVYFYHFIIHCMIYCLFLLFCYSLYDLLFVFIILLFVV